MMSPEEALKGLASIVGAGGIAGAMMAYYAYHKEALAGRKGDPAGRLPGLLAGGFEPEKSIDPLVNAITSMTAAIGSLTALLKKREEREEREIERREERERDDEMREMRDRIDDLRRQLREK